GRFITGPTSALTGGRRAVTTDVITTLAVHGGYMFLPKGGLDLGADLSLPRWTVGDSWVPRIDLDALIGADVDGDKTAVSLTANLVASFPNVIGTRSVYFGGGVGWMFGGGGSFQGKLILGTPITDR